MSCCKECTCGTQPTEERRASCEGPCETPEVQEAIDVALLEDMDLQLHTAKAAIVYWQQENRRLELDLFEARLTLWKRFKLWLKGEWESDERIRLF
jgi:hypothetical protein